MDVWTFVVTVYRNPGVEAACLHLQDRRGADVTALFFLLWAGTVCGRRYAPAEAEAVAALAARKTLTPLRGNFTVAECCAAGYSAPQLNRAGFTAHELREGGFDAQDLENVRFTVREL